MGSDNGNRRQRGLGSIYQRGRIWWVAYGVRGRKVRESSESERRKDALNLLKRRLAEIQAGKFTGPDAERVTFDDLATMLRDDYQFRGRRSWDRAERAFGRHLRGAFGLDRAVDITADRLMAYATARQAEGAALATVGYELAVLKRAFRVAIRCGRLRERPEFPTITVDNARRGFFEEGEFRALEAELPEPLKGVAAFAYFTGWRVASEILPLTWDRVDVKVGTVRLDVGTTKNREGRVFPFAALPGLREVVERQRAYTEAVQRRTGSIVRHVFHREGRPIRDFRAAWEGACKRAGLIGRIPHDFRRTAVRNLERAAVPRSVAMQLVGHKTASIYQRYAIVAEADLREGVAKLAALHGSADTTRRVLPFAAGGSL